MTFAGHLTPIRLSNKCFSLKGAPVDIVEFFGMLSNRELRLPTINVIDESMMVIFKCSSRWEDPHIQFDLNAIRVKNVLTVSHSKNVTVDMVKLRSIPREDQAAEAWRVIASAYSIFSFG